ncbi:MAG: homoserine dehydrogenase, partial [Planctomycetia bacterium]|nr:homoserine dehydrogenase [Planctomycetia bacterium]
MADTANIALLGFGTIGSGVAKLLIEQNNRISQRIGRPVTLAKIVDLDLTRDRGVRIPPGVLTDDIESVIHDPSIPVIIELIGGIEPARTFVLRALDAGKDVVTANKALLATHGTELFAAARKAGRTIAFEAAVGGGIPIVAGLGQNLVANRILSIRGILNGTCNYILSAMAEHGSSYTDALTEAQRLGYAEANPSMDVSATDATQKLAILAQLAFGATINWTDIPRIGIDTVDVADIHCAKELGYTIRLIASARQYDDGLELLVAPTLLRRGTPLAHISEAFNAIHVVGDAVGPVLFYGKGAGQMPTASAVTADLIDTLLGRTRISFDALHLWANDENGCPGGLNDSGLATGLRPAEHSTGRFYLRF